MLNSAKQYQSIKLCFCEKRICSCVQRRHAVRSERASNTFNFHQVILSGGRFEFHFQEYSLFGDMTCHSRSKDANDKFLSTIFVSNHHCLSLQEKRCNQMMLKSGSESEVSV